MKKGIRNDQYSLCRVRKIDPISLLTKHKGSLISLASKPYFKYLFLLFICLLISHGFFIYDPKYINEILDYVVKSFGKIDAGTLALVLSFYMGTSLSNYKSLIDSIPWGKDHASKINMLLQSDNLTDLKIEIIRLINQATAITYGYTSYDFVTQNVLNYDGTRLLTEDEIRFVVDLLKKTKESPHYIPIQKAIAMLSEAVENNLIDKSVKDDISKSLLEHSKKCRVFMNYQWNQTPIVYTQGVTIIVYLFFFIEMLKVIPNYLESGGTYLFHLGVNWLVFTSRFGVFFGWYVAQIFMAFPLIVANPWISLPKIMESDIDATNNRIGIFPDT